MEQASRAHLIELLAKAPIQLDLDKLVASLQKHCGAVNVISADADKGAYHIAYPDYLVSFKEGEIPAQSVFLMFNNAVDAAPYAASLQQSWRWRDAKQVVPQCLSRLAITEMLSTALPYKQRMKLIHNIVQATLAVVPCDALHWSASQQFLDPDDYLEMRAEQPDNLAFGTLNVRMFNIQARAEGETLMDTVGLATLGLPDVQCHFIKLDPNAIAQLLYNIGAYLFEHGDVISDGETVSGINEADRWRCQHENALVKPERVVLDINPGKPHAAGERD